MGPGIVAVRAPERAGRMLRQQTRRLRTSFLVMLAVVLVALPVPVAAAAIAVQPGTVNGSAALLVTGNGFGPNEAIRITGATNDGRQAVYPDARSDGSGNLNTALYAEASVVTITATGQSSQATATVPVYPVVSAIPGTTGSTYPGQPYPAQPYPVQPYPAQPYPGQQYPVQPYPSQPYPTPPYPVQPYPGQQYPVQPSAPSQPATSVAGIGQPTSVTGAGFGANERIAIWFTGPDASVTSYPGVVADSRGGVTTTAVFPSAGLWQVTLSGQSSGVTVINRFTVGGGTAGVPGPLYPSGQYPGASYLGSGVPPVPTYRSM